MAKSRVAALALALLLPAAARPAPDVVLHVDPSLHECEVHFSPQLTQSAFGRFVREFGSVSAFKQGAPPDVLGRWGVAIGVEQIFFRVDETSPAWNDTFTHPAADHWLGADKAFPKLRLRLGVSSDQQPFLSMLDLSGVVRARFGVQGDGSAGIAIGDENGKIRATMGLASDGSASLAFGDKNGRMRAKFGLSQDASPTVEIRYSFAACSKRYTACPIMKPRVPRNAV